MKTKTPLSLRRIAAGLCGFIALALTASPLSAQNTGPQQLVFTGLLGSTNTNSNAESNAQFNAVQSDSSGNLYLLLDQKDGIRLFKTDASATNILAQAQLGAAGDIGLAMALDPSGNIYIAGTITSGALAATSNAAFPTPTGTSTNAFIGKFDQNLNPIFVTYAGAGGLSVTSIAATTDAVFLTGSIFGSSLPVTPSAIIQSPASGSLQNGYVERFNSAGTTLIYATYLSGQNGNTSPAAITADASDNAYIAGYTTSTGFPTLNALIPEIPTSTSSPTSGFLTKLTPAADGILFSTFIPGPGISSIAIDPTSQTLLLSGDIATGQFPIATVAAPLVDTDYQTLLRLPLDGSTVLNSTLLAPGTQSTLTATANQNTWIAVTLTTPSWLLPLTPLFTIGNSYALRVTQQGAASPVIDQAIRFGGLPTTNPTFASVPVTITSIATDPTGQPIFAGSVSSTASATVVSEHPATYNLQLTPQSSYSGDVVLNCTPITPGQYAACSLLPSSITLNGTTQNAVATINTITTINPNTTAHNTLPHPNRNKTLLCLFPAALLFFWNTRNKKKTHRGILWLLLLTAITLWPTGCGSGGDPNIRTTPPGTYQYQVTASSTTGVQVTQTVTLNLVVTAR
jgi:hypothetical protein